MDVPPFVHFPAHDCPFDREFCLALLDDCARWLSNQKNSLFPTCSVMFFPIYWVTLGHWHEFNLTGFVLATQRTNAWIATIDFMMSPQRDYFRFVDKLTIWCAGSQSLFRNCRRRRKKNFREVRNCSRRRRTGPSDKLIQRWRKRPAQPRGACFAVILPMEYAGQSTHWKRWNLYNDVAPPSLCPSLFPRHQKVPSKTSFLSPRHSHLSRA